METAFIGLGANLGDRTQTLTSALQALSDDPDIVVAAASGPFHSDPVGGPAGQQAFVNAAARLQTSLTAATLLQRLLTIEKQHGRERRVRWGPRTLDLDLLLFGDARIDEPGLTVPHPMLTQRAFVLAPLLEIEPGLTHPVLETALAECLDQLEDHAGMRRIDGPPLF